MIIELVNNLAEPLNLPKSLPTIVILILAIGFPLAIILSWIYDLNAKGIEKTIALSEDETHEPSIVPNAWKIATYISFTIIIGLIVINLSGRFRHMEPGSIHSLVVLPFGNYTGDNQLDYFVSGMHSSLIGDMGRINGLRVISETSSNTYKDSDIPVPQIAAELNVDAIIEATVTCLDDSVCMQLKLIRAYPEEHMLWSRTYRSDKRDILNLNNWVIKDLADEIQLQLTPEQQSELEIPRPVNPNAYELYLNGKFHMGFLAFESQLTAIEYFNKALEIDDKFAEPYAGLAGVWAFLKQMDYVSPDEADPKLEKYMAKAIQLDSQNAEIHYFNGIKKVWTDFNWEEGEKAFRRCLEINPNFSLARAYYSHLLMLLKRPEEMKEQMNLALETDPQNPLIQVLEKVELMVQAEYESCIRSTKQLQQIMPNNPLIMLILFQCYTETGEYDMAIIELRKILSQLADESVIEKLNQEYKSKGFKEALVAATDVWVKLPSFASAQNAIMLYAYGGDTDQALYWLEKSYIRRDPANPYMGIIPYLRPYHDEPRYIEIMQRMKLPL